MTSKGCIYHIVRVQDLDSKIPLIESIHVVTEFPKVFPNDLLGISPEKEIDFGFSFLPENKSHLNFSLSDGSV